MHPSAPPPRPRRSLLTRLLALAVLLGSLVAVPGLASPASADGLNFTGDLQVGATITPRIESAVIQAVETYSDSECRSRTARIDEPGRTYTFDRQAEGQYVQVFTRDELERGSGCIGPVAAAPHYTGTLKVGETLTAAPGREFTFVDYYASPGCEGFVGSPFTGANSTYVIPDMAAGRYVRVRTKNTGRAPEEFSPCAGPVASTVRTFSDFTAASYSGTSSLGGTLTADRPSVPADATVTYAWTAPTADGVEVLSTEQTYSPKAADRGKDVTLKITAAKDGYTTTSQSTSVGEISGRSFGADVFDGVTLVDSTPGTPLRAGDVLTLSDSTGENPDGTTFTARFGRGNGDGCDAAQEPASSYELTAEDVGSSPCAVVTASAPDYDDTSTNLYSDETVQGDFSDGAAVLSGTPKVGEKVTVDLEGVSPKADGLSRVWTIGGRTVSESSSYTPEAADAGKALSVTVTASREGYVDRSYETSGVVGKGALKADAVTVLGTPQVGETLTADLGEGAGVEGATPTYDWGVQLPGEEACESIGVTSRTITLPKSARGSKVCVTVTYTADGYETTTRTSDLTHVVTGLDPQPWPPTISDATPTFGDTLTASVDERDLPDGADVSYAWGHLGENGCELFDAAPTAKHEVGLADLGERLCVTSTVKAFGYEDGSATSRPTAEAQKASMGQVTASLSDTTPTVGDTITASYTGAGVPEGADVSYRFETVGTDPGPGPDLCEIIGLCGPGPIPCNVFGLCIDPCLFIGGCVDVLRGAALAGSGAEREVTPEDVGRQLRATVTITEPGFEDAVATTDLTEPVAKATFTGAKVEITGALVVDGTLTAETTSPEQEAQSSGTVWTIGDTTIEDPGSYVLKPEDAGKTATITVTFGAPGYETATVSDSATVEKATFVGGGVSLGTTPTVDAKLTPKVTEPEQEPGTTTTVWSIDDEVVQSAEDGSYTPKAADAGKTLTLTVTFSRDGYTDRVRTASAEVAKATMTGGSVRLSSESAQVGQEIQATGGVPSPRPEGGTAVWTVGGVKVAEGVSAYRPTAVDAGKTLTLTTTWTKPGYEDVVRTVSIAKIAPAPKKVSVDKASVRRGESFTVTATGLKPGQLVDVRLAGRKIGIARTNVYGSVTKTVMFPSSATPGKNQEVRVTAFVKSKGRYVVDAKVSTSITLTR